MPLFFVGLASLAFSQFENSVNADELGSEELVDAITELLSRNQAKVDNLRMIGASSLNSRTEQFELLVAEKASLNSVDTNQISKLKDDFQSAVGKFEKRLSSTTDSIEQSGIRIFDAEEIFSDLEKSFAGRLEEARSPLMILHENLTGTEVEINALSKMIDGVIEDFRYETQNAMSALEKISPVVTVVSSPPELSQNAESPAGTAVKAIRESPSVSTPTSSIGRKIASVISADRPVAFDRSSLAGPSFSELPYENYQSATTLTNSSDQDLILSLRKELANSKSLQSELSIDSASLKADLRKAYREIVALQNNLQESQSLINELEQTKQNFYKNEDGSRATAQMVSQRIKRLESELSDAKEALSQARQSLLLEQQRSNSMIGSITTELERTRKELDVARRAAQGSGVNYEQLALLEQELTKAKQALNSARNQNFSPVSEDYSKLQEELRKSLGEIARMQIELSDKEELQQELNDLKDAFAKVDDSNIGGDGHVSAKYVKKLLADLGSANEEVARLKRGTTEERGALSGTVDDLERKLRKSKADLAAARSEITRNQEELARRELDFANTIKKLEDEAEIAQAILQQAADGKISAVPFISEMEEDLASSESRIRSLSDQFASEQAKASEVIDGLKEELELAKARQKQSLDQIERRELELTGKDKELESLSKQRKQLEEELQVVKVIAGQLQDLNKVLEETKEAQSSQSLTSDQVVDSLRNELNKAKVELVVSQEEMEKLRKDYSDRIASLERQLDDSRHEIVEEQELFYENSEESKNLILELKNELQLAQKEILRMKSSGITESVETKQAVSQLEEALGTIRILQESLEEAEKTNLELDNLRTDLADSMSKHLLELQNSEDEKLSLAKKISDLEVEIDVLRSNSLGDGLAKMNDRASLNERIVAGKESNEILRQRLADAESLGVSSIVGLEDEIAELRIVNEDLRSQLSEKPQEQENLDKIRSLETELANAVRKLKVISGDTSQSSTEDLLSLQLENDELREEVKGLRLNLDELSSASVDKSVSSKSAIVSDLQKSLERAISRIDKLEDPSSPIHDQYDEASLDELSEELARAETTIGELQEEIDNRESSQANLLAKLEDAFVRIKALESDSAGLQGSQLEEWQSLESELAESKMKIMELSEEIELLAKMKDVDSLSDEFTPEIADRLSGDQDVLAMQMEIEALRAELLKSREMEDKLPSEDDLISMQMEIEALREELSLAKQMSNDDSPANLPDDEIQEQLRIAVSESFELQMELEQTREKLNELEAMVSQTGSPSIDSSAISNAQARIDQLTMALQNSEQLREETEDLVVELEKQSNSGPADYANDPNFIELQQEMLALQNELLMVQEMEDPRISEMEESLELSRADARRLTSEFQRVTAETERLNLKLASLNEENVRLRNLASSKDNSSTQGILSSWKERLSSLESENSSLLAQLAEKERRISGLLEEMKSPAGSPNEGLLQAQLEELSDKLRQSRSGEDRMQTENRLLQDELMQARLQLKNLESSRQAFNASVPDQTAELKRLSMENESLQGQIALLEQLPDRERLENQIRELSQSNMNAQVMFDQERALVNELKRQLTDARNIKQEVLERGKSSRLKIDLLNDELSDARFRIQSLEKALVSARNAIRVLQDGGSVSTMIPVSNPLTSGGLSDDRLRRSSFSRNPLPSTPSGSRFTRQPSTLFLPEKQSLPEIKNTSGGDANLKVEAKVKFLDNKIRPAAFTEFFVVDQDLETLLRSENIQIPRSEGIQSFAEFWARSVQRGYKFPGIAAKIRNALARSSLRRIKTNSLGEGNLDNLATGKYYLVGTSPLGQVGVVWSKAVMLNNGDNRVELSLADASWAQ